MTPNLPAIAGAIRNLIVVLQEPDPTYGSVVGAVEPLHELLHPDWHWNQLHPAFRTLDERKRGALQDVVDVCLNGSWLLSHAYAGRERLTAALSAIAPKPSPNDPRDKFIYESMEAGKTLLWIRDQLKKREKKWGYIDNAQGISQAARRHAERQGKPWPVKR